MRRLILSILVSSLAWVLGAAEAPRDDAASPIFDGTSLAGWHRSNEPGHGSGCNWDVKDGAIRGIQDYPGAWGIIRSEGKYGDFELTVEVKAAGPFEAGIIVRSTGEGHGYLIAIHPSPGGDVGGITGSRFGDFRAPAAEWKKAWKKDDWNELRVAVKGQPPEIRTWVNGRPMAELKGAPTDPRVGAEGHVALKLGGPADCFSDPILFRNIRMRTEAKVEARP
jgi:hypothetical protein